MPTSKLVASAEVFGAMLSAGIADDTAIKQDPKGYIARAVHVDLEDSLDVQVVSNDADTVNLTLPYYSSVVASKAEALSLDDMEAASGGMYMDIIHGGRHNYVLNQLKKSQPAHSSVMSATGVPVDPNSQKSGK